MNEVRGVAFDCDGVLAANDSSWQNIHDHFGTENSEMLAKFLRKEITDAEFVLDDIRMWREVQPEIHRDDIMRCYSGIKLMPGAREVVEELQNRGILVAIVSSGVDLLIGSIANMLKVDDWAANGFEWNEEGWLIGPKKTMVDSHDKGAMVEKFARINAIDPAYIVSVGDFSCTEWGLDVGNSGSLCDDIGHQKLAIDSKVLGTLDHRLGDENVGSLLFSLRKDIPSSTTR